MKISTKILSKNHNVSNETEEKYLLKFLGYLFFAFGLVYLFFLVLAYVLIFFIPLETETRWFSGYKNPLGETLTETPAWLLERYEDIPYRLGVLPDMEEANAFSTLGGHIYVTQKLLDELEYTETLDFIIGHEKAHIEHRDMLKTLIPTLPLLLLFSFTGGEDIYTLFDAFIGKQFSKNQEIQADISGLDFAFQKNKHIGCALLFFESGNTMLENIGELFSTHPMTEFRIQKAKAYIVKMGYPEKPCTPLGK